MEEMQTTEPAPAPAEPKPEAGKNGLVHILEVPLVLAGGKTVDRLNLDFRKLKSKGFIAVEKQFGEYEKKFVALPWTDARWQLMAAARLNGLIFEDLLELDGGDYVNVTQAVKDFFTDRVKS